MFKTIKKIVTHISCVQKALFCVIGELRQRALVHDASKFNEDELKYYTAYENFPEGLKFGSKEYKAAEKRLNVGVGSPGFGLHTYRNDHHPEFHENAHSGTTVDIMGLFPIIEMVCDWAGAHVAYGNESDWFESVTYNMNRFEFSDAQKWVIGEVASLLYKEIPQLAEKKGDAKTK